MTTVVQPDHGKASHLGENWKLMGDTVASDRRANIRRKNQVILLPAVTNYFVRDLNDLKPNSEVVDSRVAYLNLFNFVRRAAKLS